MATRFYFGTTAFSTITPAVSGSWDYSVGSFARYGLETETDTGDIMVTASLDGNTDTADTDYCYRQWISDPIAAQTISAQTIDIQMRALEEDAKGNQFLALTVRVLSNDGTTVRGTALALTRDGTVI
jgi:hypothetical protein